MNVTATSTNISTYGTLTLNNTGGTTNINDSLFSANLLTTTGSSASPYGAAIAVYTYAEFWDIEYFKELIFK